MEERTCRICGCIEDNACEGGCSWVEEDLCSACVDAKDENVDGDDDQDDAADVDVIEKASEVKVKSLETANVQSGTEKLKSEFSKFKGSGKEGAVSKPVLEALLLFCKDENFSKAVESNSKTFSDCIKAIMSGVGNVISDLEVYQRAAGFYFPKAKIQFQMTIETEGLQIPVKTKAVTAEERKSDEKAATNNVAPIVEAQRKKITISLDGL